MKKTVLAFIFVVCFLTISTVGLAANAQLNDTEEIWIAEGFEVDETLYEGQKIEQVFHMYGMRSSDYDKLSGTGYAVSFLVLDQKMQPVAGAALVVGSVHKGTTDKDGKITIRMPDGQYQYQFKKITHEKVSGSFRVTGADVNITVEAMQQLSNLRFSITDGDVGLGGASVTVGDKTVSTSAGGAASFWLEDGAYPYTVSREGFDNASGVVVVEGDTTCYVELSGGNRVEFNVTNEAGEAVSGANISIGDVRSIVTDSYGNARTWVEKGTYQYQVTHASMDQRAGTFAVNDSVTLVSVEMTRKRYVAAFTVTDVDGKPVPDAKITIPEHVVYTNKSGKSQIKSLLPGNYEISVSKDGYQTYAGEFAVNNKTARITVVLAAVVAEPTPSPTPTVQPPTPAPQPPTPKPQPPTQKPTSKPSGSGGTGTTATKRPTPTSSAAVPEKSAEPTATPSPTPIPKKDPVIASTQPSPSPSPAAAGQTTETPKPTDPPATEQSGLYSVGFNLVDANGEPLVDMLVELHSELMSGRTDNDGYIFFIDVPPEVHTLYLKNDDNKVLAKADFVLEPGEETTLNRSDGQAGSVLVKEDINAITLDVVYDQSNLVLAGVHQGWSQFYSELPRDQAAGGAQNPDVVFWLIVSIAVLLLVIVVLIVARRNLKLKFTSKNDYLQDGSETE